MILKKTVLTKKYIYNLKYMLFSNNKKFYIAIKSDKLNREEYFTKGVFKSIKTEKSCVCVEKTTYKKIYKLFCEMCSNLVFPCSLKYIIEDTYNIKEI